MSGGGGSASWSSASGPESALESQSVVEFDPANRLCDNVWKYNTCNGKSRYRVYPSVRGSRSEGEAKALHTQHR